jgi:hypothetical protein
MTGTVIFGKIISEKSFNNASIDSLGQKNIEVNDYKQSGDEPRFT